MKLQTTITSTVEKEVELPYFCKSGKTFLKVVGDNKCIAVVAYEFCTSIESTDSRYSGVIGIAEPCSEEEFEAAYDLAFEVIKNLRGKEVSND